MDLTVGKEFYYDEKQLKGVFGYKSDDRRRNSVFSSRESTKSRYEALGFL